MERLSIQELATVLVTKSGLKKKDAERFAITMFDIVKDGLAADRQVKIKGLGTFKVIDIDSRESIDVNTGERVLIEGHEKITFTPDLTMKELVNKPFSQFETVVLNDGVEFDDDLEQEAEASLEEDIEQEPAPVVEPVPVVKPVPAPILEFTDAQEKLTEKEPTDTIEEELSAETIAEEEPENDVAPSRIKWIWWLLAIMLALGVGYWLGRSTNGVTGTADTSSAKQLAEDSVKGDTIARDTIAKPDSVKKDSVVPRPKPDIQQKPAEPKPVEPKSAELVIDYGQLDARVRTGAYCIIGTAHEVKVRAGETVKRISQRYLGPDMECYVEAYNGLKANAVLKEGQMLKIPQLELKKKKKQQIKK